MSVCLEKQTGPNMTCVYPKKTNERMVDNRKEKIMEFSSFLTYFGILFSLFDILVTK